MIRFRPATHVCPECLGLFLSEGKCRGTMDKGFHPEPVQTLPLVTCEEPEREYIAVFPHHAFIAKNADQARSMALSNIKGMLGRDTKLAEKMLDRIGFAIDVQQVSGPR